MGRISDVGALRAMYPPVVERAVKKELTALETHCRRFISLSPFLVISTMSRDGHADASPRGEAPGFVQVLSDTLIALPDRPGNNRLDTFANIIENPGVGLIFLVPGVNEVLRINGRAELRDDAELMARFVVNGKPPRLVVLVHVEAAYLHCAKAIMRAGLWNPDALVDRSALPTMAAMIRDQSGDSSIADEGQVMMEARYRTELF
jgi:PPOX class probable FMN-dependent enzyme